jgi:hypothetical protein
LQTYQDTERIPIRGRYDVLVAGGGLAGVAAAMAARRDGRRVLLLEKSLTLGGLATLGLINLFVPMCNGRGTQIIKGMAEELLRLSVRYGFDTIPEEWREREPGEGARTRYVTRFSAQIFALALVEWIQDAGIDLLLDTVVVKPVMAGAHCRGLIVENKTGRGLYEGGMVVDATGDADILYRAGVPTVQGENFFTYATFGVDLESCRRAAEKGRIDLAYRRYSGGQATLYGQKHPEGMKRFGGTSAEEVTEYVVKNQRILLDSIKGDDRSTRDVVVLPGMAQFRTTRRIDGAYTLTTDDQYRHFADSIGAIGDFEQNDYLYEVPLRCLVHPDYDNLITAGRSAAAAGYAWDVLRVIPPAILTGQAAGLCASQALAEAVPVRQITLAPVQQKLADSGVIIHFDDALIPTPGAASAAPADIGHF